MNKNSFLYNPKTYTLTSMLIGYLLIGNLTAVQQNAIGNWLMTIAQILEANSAVQQAIEEAFQGNTVNINSQKYKKGGSPIMDNEPLLDYFKNNNDGQTSILELKDMLDKLKEELDKLSNSS